ncbi:MAG: hypothetical protein CMM10_05345 [Rhodospirillaceae bacterium]|jgi:hypothetical protein|nr:hypothetical protein [Rhodospirillaceae bacterium]MDP6645991.1 ankyrin repeat domain-containing protein [Rhodospirillales bacterium]
MRNVILLVLSCWLAISSTGLAQTPPSPSELKAYTGFHAAAARGDVDAIERLVRAGQDINDRDSQGRTPVMVAAHFKNLDAAAALIKGGANLNLFDNQAYDVLTISGVLDDVPMVKLAIANGANPGLVTSPYRGTALIASAHLGHDRVVAELIKAGAPLDHVNNLHWTALIEAIVLGVGGPRHVACVSLLVAAGANVNLADGNGTSPLSLAQQRGYSEMVEILKNSGAKP